MKKLTLLTYLTVGCLLFTGCNDLLEAPQPATSVSGDKVLTTEDGVRALRASMYSRLVRSFDYSTEYFIGPSAIADETRNRSGSTRFQGLNDLNGNDGGTNGLSSYGSTYDLILDANLMISAVEDGVLANQSELDRYRGEAYTIRALAMHHLVRVLGYDPGMSPSAGPGAGFDLGIIIRTEPTLDISDVDNRERATVEEVYNQILSDLSEAKTLLAGQTNNTRITEAFVDGLTARVNLYAGNWSAADAAATEAIANSGLSLANTAADVAGMFDETDGNHPEALFKLVVDPNTEAIGGNNTNNGLAAYTSDQWIAQVPSQFVLDLYDPSDYRIGSYQYDENGDPVLDGNGVHVYEGGWYQRCFNSQQGTPVAGCEDVNSDTLSSIKWGGEKGNLADDIPFMRLSEMYLIQAEARAKASGSVADGLAPLNTLREARGLDPLSATLDFTGNDLDAFEDEVLDERVRELVLEGHRFFDLKRLGRDIPNPDGTTKVRYDSYRILDDIGASIIGVNPLIVENPGYND